MTKSTLQGKKNDEMLSLQVPGKGVRATVGEIHCTQSCPRKAQKTKKKEKKEGSFFHPGTGEEGYSCWRGKCCTQTENIADAQVHLKEQSEQDMRGPW